MSKLTKTMQALLDRRAESPIWVDEIRESNAARALVAAGLASQWVNHGCMVGGEYRVSPFTRKAYTTKTRFCAGGQLFF